MSAKSVLREANTLSTPPSSQQPASDSATKAVLVYRPPHARQSAQASPHAPAPPSGVAMSCGGAALRPPLHPARLAALAAAIQHASCSSSKDDDPPTPTGARLPAPGLPSLQRGGQQEADTPSPTSPSFLSRLPPPELVLGELPQAAATPASVAPAPTRPAATLKATNIICGGSSSGPAVDVAELLATLESLMAGTGLPCASGYGNSSAAAASTAAAPSMPAVEALGPLLSMLSRGVLEQADDASLAALLRTLPRLLLRARGASGWAVPRLNSLLEDLQSACKERLNLLDSGTPPQPTLLSSLFAFVSRAVGAGALVTDGLLQGVTAYLSHAMPSLELKMLAGGLHTLAVAGWMPGGSPTASVSFGNQAVERLLQLREAGWAAATGGRTEASGAGTLPDLPALATAVEALSELACVDRLAGIALANVVVDLVLAGEAAGALDLAQVARCVASLAVICSSSPGAMSTSAAIRLLTIWRLLSLRVERTSLAEPGLARVLSSMWTSSCLLSAAIGSSDGPDTFRLAGAMGMTACAAWSREAGVGAGVSPAQRRVLAALHSLPGGGWPAAAARLNVLVGDLVTVPVLAAGPGGRKAAILLHGPQDVFLNSRSGTPRGSAAAREQMLKAAGLLVVRLDRLSALALPVEALAEELGALLSGGPGTLAQLVGAAT